MVNGPARDNNVDEDQPSSPAPLHSRLNREARELLKVAEAGGIPLFTSANLRRIANDNGVETPPHKTPNEIIEELRARAAETEQLP